MRIVVKVGTSTLAHSTGRLNIRHTEDLVKVLSDLKNAGHEVILVSSGAIGMGVGKLSLPSRPGDMATKQACAAVGQCELMYTYDRLFTAYNHNVAQILLTGVDVEHEGRRLNFQNTLTRLLELGALPIINENDTVATDEITSIGDNDTLAAIVTCCIHADLLVLLSDIDGLYTANPHTHPDAKLIPVVERITPEVLALADGAGSALGTGGMSTKLRAAQMVTAEGADMVIANGSHPELLYDIADGTGVRVSLFVSGCRHHCKGCFNGETWDFNSGKEFKKENLDYILENINKNSVQRDLSILGGEPLCPENVDGVIEVCKRFKEEFPNKKIYMWTGYTVDDFTERQKEVLKYLDVLVDGPFQQENRNLSLTMRGSSNQRVIDVKKSLAEEKIVLVEA